jgi:hypothetical protein
LCAVCDAADVAKQIAQSMKAVYDAAGINSRIRASKVLKEGAQVLKVE